MKFFFVFVLMFVATELFAQHLPVCKEVYTDIPEMERRQFDAKHISGKGASLSSSNFSVHYYKCYWNIDPAVRYIDGRINTHFIITASTDNIVFDFTDKLTVDSVLFRNKKTGFTQGSNKTLTIELGDKLNQGKKDSLDIYYHGVPPIGQDFTGGFVQSTHNSTPVIWTLSEPYNAKDWWPCRNGLEDKVDSIDIFLTHPSAYNASSNGVLQSVTNNGSVSVSFYKHRYPVATYLVAFAVTNFSVFTDDVLIDDTLLPVISYVYPESLNEFKNNNYIVLNGLKLFSDSLTNYPYLKERYGQTQFGWGGGMEHQTNSFVINAGENLVTHELAHQWFGDKITCGSWQDIWLNEGFATYMADFFYTEHFNPSTYAANVSGDLSYIVSQPAGSVWVNDTTNASRIFDGRLSYNKGAFLLRMLRFTLGDKAFFQGLRNYQNDPALRYGFARTADFQKHMENVSGTDLNYFFDQWFYGQGYPSFKINWYQAPDGKIVLRINQTTSNNSVSFFRVSLPVKLVGENSTKTIVIENTKANQYVVVGSPGFGVKNILIDPEQFLISKNNKAIKAKVSDNGF